MFKQNPVPILAARSRANLQRRVQKFGLISQVAHDEKLERLRARIASLGADPRSIEVLVGVLIALEELPLTYGVVRSVAGSKINFILGMVAELIEAAADEDAARQLLAGMADGFNPGTTDG